MKRMVLLLAGLLLCLAASAQRTVPGQSAISAEGLWTGSSFGAGLNYSRCLQGGYWSAGIAVTDNRGRLSNGGTIQYDALVARGQDMWRLLSTRSRSLALYAGGGAFVGYEFYDPFLKLDGWVDTGLPPGGVIYGVRAGLSVECFLFPRLALAVGASVPVNFSSPMSRLRYEVVAGLKVYL